MPTVDRDVELALVLIRAWLLEYDHNKLGEPAPRRSRELTFDALATVTDATEGR